MTRVRLLLPPLLGCVIFLLCSLLVLPYPGIQNDEAFFAGPLYSGDASYFNAELFGHKIPLMVMSYSGALKTWLYGALWGWICDPSLWSLRLPVVFFGICTIVVTWSFVRRLAGDKTAAITTLLLATDTCFQLTNTFDWGPVALQHLLLMAGLACIHRWLQDATKFWPLALGAFFWGLGLWDKALLIWPLAALTFATAAFYPRELFRRLRDWRLAVVCAFFLTGAAPLLWFNLDRPAATVTANTHFSFEHAAQKIDVLQGTFDGSALFDYIVRGAYATEVREPATWLEKASVAIARTLGDHRHNLNFYTFVLVIVIAAWYRSKPAFYFLTVSLLIWLQMFVTEGAGRGAHHIILLWPFPILFLGITLSRLPNLGRTALMFVMIASSLLNLNGYLSEFIRYGPTVTWTDAVIPLARALESKSVEEIEVVDWGYLTSLQVLLDGSIPVKVVETDTLPKQLASPKHIFVQHTPGNEITAGVNARLVESATKLGYSPKSDRTIRDRNGREIFELLHFEKTP